MTKEYVKSDLRKGMALLCTQSEEDYWTEGKFYPLNDRLGIMDDDEDVTWHANEVVMFLNTPSRCRSFELVDLVENYDGKHRFELSDIKDGMILVCTKSDCSHWTVGKEYEVNNGRILDDDGHSRNAEGIMHYLNDEYCNILNFKLKLKGINYKFEPINIDAPDYYTGGIETKDYIRSHNLNFNRGSAVKYATRAGKKDKDKEIEDLKKAINFLQFEIEYLENENCS